ncbi:MAG: (5-formylfuran-3-yl)methyl phosphate synthase [Methylococcaceae bacterium]|nr:(5-formylfuran-3-yl)methyl phosphate synthase [Methylococcaceae bacterium]
MSLMLASVNSLEEARLVKGFGVDIIDLKQPALGALGALDLETVTEIVAALKPSAQISATVGDLPMQADVLGKAVQEMAATGVDYVKIGFFPGGDWPGSMDALAGMARQGRALIAVLFADTHPDFSLIETLASAGFRGVMLDTMDKRRGSLTDLMAIDELQEFVRTAKACSLLTGLAGSLKASDIGELLPLDADYLGFRGALCRERNRTAALDEGQVLKIKELLKTKGTGFMYQGTKQHDV